MKGGGMHVLLVCKLRAASMWSVFTSLCCVLVGSGLALESVSYMHQLGALYHANVEFVKESMSTCNVRCPRL